MGCMSNELSVVIPPESVRVVRLTPLLDKPQVIGTDVRVRMGQVELSNVSYCEKTRTLGFAATRPVGEDGSVFPLMPQNLLVNNSSVCYTARNRNGTTGDLMCASPCALIQRK